MKCPSLRAQPTIGSPLSKNQNSDMQGEVFGAPLLKAKKIEEAFRLPDFFSIAAPLSMQGKAD